MVRKGPMLRLGYYMPLLHGPLLGLRCYMLQREPPTVSSTACGTLTWLG